MADALALGAMKDVISCDKLGEVQITFDQRFPNGTTRRLETRHLIIQELTQGTETS